MIRLGGIADLDAIVALEFRCFGDADAFPRRTWRRLFGPATRQGSVVTMVLPACDAASAQEATPSAALAVAIGLLRNNSRVLRLYSLAVDPSQRGKGLGRTMIAALVRVAPQRCDTLSLEVRIDNAPARALYESLGMREVGTLPDYYRDGSAGLRYRARFSALRLERMDAG